MEKQIIENWHKNKEIIKNDIINFIEEEDYISYDHLVEIVWERTIADYEDYNVHKFDLDESYSGDLVFLYRNGGDIFIVVIGYGSCSVCDALVAAGSNIDDLMTLALHIAQRTKLLD